jgi:hypothetical protein
MSLFFRRVVSMGIVVSLHANPVQAQVQSRVGKVVALDGASSEYVVTRQGQPVPITFNMALMIGDEVKVSDPTRSIKVRYVDGGEETITRLNSPFRFNPRAEVADTLSNFLRDLWKNVTKAHDDGLRTIVIRDPDRLSIAMPGLSDKTARIEAGDRHFMLVWRGGRGPYRVTVRDDKTQIILDEEELPTRQLVVSSRTTRFNPGRYTVEVSTGGQRASGEFTAVASGRPTPTALASDPEGAVAAAEALAEENDRALLYEAYLRLYAGIRDQYGLAQALADYFAVGAP